VQKEFHTAKAPELATHPYNDPSLGPLEFLRCVYRDPLLPMSIRIDAARGLLPYTEPRPASSPSSHIGCTIVIGGLGPRATDPPEQINENLQSFSVSADNSCQPSSEPPAPVNTETNSYPQTFIDYSTPPTPAELQEIKAAINRLRPDLAHLPIPEPHLCACGHWIFGPCPLGERCCDRTKLN
jgi:hypothetical protein